jgi:hypothetical protein
MGILHCSGLLLEKIHMNHGIVRKIIMIVFILLLCTAGLTLYAGEARVLIANQGSEFKDAVVEKLRDEMRESSISFTVQKLNTLGRVKPEEWDAVVILHAVKIGSINKNVERFFNRIDDYSKVIVCTTCGDKDRVSEKYGIDSITAASKKEEVSILAQQIEKRLQNILGI